MQFGRRPCIAPRNGLHMRTANVSEASAVPNPPNGSPRRPGALAGYAPPFLAIEARCIHDWADGIDARRLLPVLLRKLIHSTGRELSRVDFPGYDNAENKGWDGTVEAGAATPWIPVGTSGWEFGTAKDPRRKADRDYAARIRSTPPAGRGKSAFVFVTPRNWPGKAAWAADKRAEGHWNDVRALDASDLEQWLEHAIPAQIWMAEQLGRATDDCETPDRFWRRWAEAGNPPLTPAIFEAAITEHRRTLEDWLAKKSDRPLVAAADSTGEALAFLSCIFQRHDIVAHRRDLAAICHSARTLRKLASAGIPLIPIVHTHEAERELSSVYRQRHCIIVRPRNAVGSEPDIALRQLKRDAFRTALADMGIDGDKEDLLARETGRSPTILRRRISDIPAIRTPEWAERAETARDLIPLALIGAWRADSKADRQIVSALAGTPYDDIEKTIARMLKFDDSPVWSIGQYRGVASKVDAIFAVSGQTVGKDLNDFLLLAEYVLAEEDPALDLPENMRRAAGVYGKIRDHSSALRDGIRDTLVMLSVHGHDLFRVRTGIDVEARVAALIRNLLTPLTIDKLLSHNRDLPDYAEAAPGIFLRLIEEDLQRPQPAVFALLKPVARFPFGQCLRTGLLWALECLAWTNLGRASAILARLSSIEIHDNYTNKPIASLKAIYRSRLPQTAAPVDERIQSLRNLARRFPDVGWSICIAQLYIGPDTAIPNYRPRWRDDASGVGRRPVTAREGQAFECAALDIALSWRKHDYNTLGDLVEEMPGIDERDQGKIWDLVDVWASSERDPNAKAHLWERILRCGFTHHAEHRRANTETSERARQACANLRPADPVMRNARLFGNHAVYFLEDEPAAEGIGYAERVERAARLRSEAMQEIWAECGHDGVVALLAKGGIADVVGFFLAPHVHETESRVAFVRNCLSQEGALREKISSCIRGFFRSMDQGSREALILTVAKDGDTEQLLRLLLCAPSCRDTWRLLGRYPRHVRDRYWRTVDPDSRYYNDAENNELLDRLVDAARPHAAFHVLAYHWSGVETSRLKRLLYAVSTAKPDSVGSYVVVPRQVSEALDSLDGRAGVGPDEMAELEFAFVETLDDSKHGIPNLERRIAESPDVFARFLALAFTRRGEGCDPPERSVQDPGQRNAIGLRAHLLLDRIGRIPGATSDGEIDAEALSCWIDRARELCMQSGRTGIGDSKIGQLLSHAPSGKNGLWPCDAVCEAMERVASRYIGRGFIAGVRNARGMHSRELEEGGDQERVLAAQYRNWAQQRAAEYPYVGSVLMGIADSYDHDAAQEDDESEIDKRLGL